jgi:plasmid stability protein
MATLTIRRLDDEVYEALKLRAQRNRRSLEAEAREILTARTQSRAALADHLRDFHAQMVARHGILPDSTPLIREMRDTE